MRASISTTSEYYQMTSSCDANTNLSESNVVSRRKVLSWIYVLYISTLMTTAYQEQHVFKANFTQYAKSKCDTWDPGITIYRTVQPDSDTHLMDFTCQWTKFTNRVVGLHYNLISACLLHSQLMNWIMELWIISFRPP